MNKNLMIVVGIVLLLLVGAGSFFVLGNKSETPGASPSSATIAETSQMDTTSQRQSLFGLMKSTSNQKCTFNDSELGSSGTVYGGVGRVRGDFVSNTNGQAMTSHMIADATTIYVWVEGETQGFKAAKDAAEKLAGSAGQKGFDVNKQVDYACTPWTADTSFFEVPTNVTFTDFSGMMQQDNTSGSSQNGNMKAAQCAACESLTGEEQAQCKQALGC